MKKKLDLDAVQTRLQTAMLGRLSTRWEKAGAHIPPGGTRVHTAVPLDERDRQDFDVYVTAYFDAVADFMDMLNPEQAEFARMVASMPAHMVRTVDTRSDLLRGSHTGSVPQKPAKGPGVRRQTAARARLEALFKGNGNDDV
jgi:hypothetical protein